MQTILLFQIFFTVSLTINQISTYLIDFPYEEFFNVSLTDAPHLTSYLCSVNPNQTKCCSCVPDQCFENCCIDASWQTGTFRNMSHYINHVKTKQSENSWGHLCNPIIGKYPLDHTMEHVPTYMYDPIDTRPQNSSRSKKVASRFRTPLLYRRYEILFRNRKLAKEIGIEMKDLHYLNLTVKCQDSTHATSFKDGAIFNAILQNKLRKCIYRYIRNEMISDSFFTDFTDVCPHEMRRCTFGREDYWLCRAYMAPIYGFKNPHCYQCHYGKSVNTSDIDHCTEACFNGTCPLEKINNNNHDENNHNNNNNNDNDTEYKLTFDLYSSRNGSLVINNYKCKLSYENFLNSSLALGSSKYRQHFLCSSLNTFKLCSCDKNCMKFRTCCMDYLRNTATCLSVQSYTHLFITTASQHKSHKCQNVVPFTTHKHNVKYLMIASCMESAHGRDVRMCLHAESNLIQSLLPVVGSDGYLYKNVFCARCNFVEISTPVGITIGCKGNNSTSPSLLDMRHECWFTVSEVDIKKHDLKTCGNIKDWKRSCNQTRHLTQACNAYQGRLIPYSNPFCSICYISVYNSKIPNFPLILENNQSYWSFNIKFDSSLNIKEVKAYSNKTIPVNLCTSGKFFDLFDPIQCNDFTQNNTVIFDRCLHTWREYLIIESNSSEVNSSEFINTISNLSFLLDVRVDPALLYYHDEVLSVYKIENTRTTADVSIPIDQTSILLGKFDTTLTITTFLSSLHGGLNNKTEMACKRKLPLNITAIQYLSNCSFYYGFHVFERSDVIMETTFDKNGTKSSLALCCTNENSDYFVACSIPTEIDFDIINSNNNSNNSNNNSNNNNISISNNINLFKFKEFDQCLIKSQKNLFLMIKPFIRSDLILGVDFLLKSVGITNYTYEVRYEQNEITIFDIEIYSDSSKIDFSSINFYELEIVILSSSLLPIFHTLKEEFIFKSMINVRCEMYLTYEPESMDIFNCTDLYDRKRFRSHAPSFSIKYHHDNFSLTTVRFFSKCEELPKQDFPATDFFDDIAVTEMTSYLCHENPNEPKCCNCFKNCTESCCADVFWNEYIEVSDESKKKELTPQKDQLTDYISYFVNKRWQEKSICLPIIPPSLGHKCEHLPTIITYVNEENNTVKCPTQLVYLTIQLLYFSRTTRQIYINKECGIKNGALDTEPMNITASCNKMKSTLEDLTPFYNQNLDGCVFEADIPDSVRNNIKKCPHEVSACGIHSPHYDLCRSYAAPTRDGFKNPHCLKCMGMFGSVALAKCEGKCLNGECPLKEKTDYNLHFKAYQFNEKVVVKDLFYRFPLKEFLGADIGRMSMDSMLCTPLNKVDNKCCDCDGACVKYKTCCMDKFWDSSKPISINDYKTLLIEKSKEFPDPKCQSLVPMSGHDKTMYYLMIDSCPEDSDKSLSIKCSSAYTDSSIRSFVPVIGGRTLYRNMHCALCNGVKLYVPVPLIAHCSDFGKVPDSKLNLKNNCYYSIDDFDTIRYNIKACKKEEAIICDKDSQFYDLCHSYRGSYRNHYNFHCYRCRYGNYRGEREPLIPENKENQCSMSSMFIWHIRISFNAETMKVKEIVTFNLRVLSTCATDNFFGVLSNPCVLIEVIETETVADIQELNHDSKGVWSQYERCTGNKLSQAFLVYPFSTDDRDNFNKTLRYLKREFKVSLYYGDNDRLIYNLSDVALDRFLKSLYTEAASYIFTPTIAPVINNVHEVYFPHSFSDGRICHDLELIDNQSISISDNCSLSILNEPKQFSNVLLLVEGKGKSFSEKIVYCKRFYMSTPCSSMERYDAKFSPDEQGNIMINSISYPVDSYQPLPHGRVLVCTTNTAKADTLKTIATINISILYIGFAISLPSYIVLLIVFVAMKKSKVPPREFTFGLILTLLTGDSLYFLNKILNLNTFSIIADLCNVILFSINFANIKAHLWAIIIVFYETHTKNNTSFSGRRKNYIYVLLTSSVALLLLSLPIITDDFQLKLQGNNSHVEKICKAQNEPVRFYFYSLTNAVLFLIPLVALIQVRVKLMASKGTMGQLPTYIPAFLLKILLLLFTTEFVGLILISLLTSTHERKNTMYLFLELLYTFSHGFRGVGFLSVYMYKYYRYDVEKVITNVSQMTNVTNNTNSMVSRNADDDVKNDGNVEIDVSPYAVYNSKGKKGDESQSTNGSIISNESGFNSSIDSFEQIKDFDA